MIEHFKRHRLFILLFVGLMFLPDARAQIQGAQKSPALTPAERDAAVRQAERQEIVDQSVGKVMRDFSAKKLNGDQIAVTLIDLHDPEHPVQASYRGDVQIYPASVIKLFYMVAAHRQMEDGKLQDTPELRRAMHDMIVDSLNEATGYIVDLLTDTTSGPELSPAEITQWHDKRDAVNRYYTSLGYKNINVNKKPWCEGPYGRETQAIKLFKPSRNQLTTDATARLLSEIVTGKAVSPARCEQMKELLRRDFADPNNHNTQAKTFSSPALPKDAKLWSKAGWTNDSRHDAAYIELPNGMRFVLVTFTTDHANDHDIIAAVARYVVQDLSKLK
jgi:beta-lactamase class A